MFYIVACFLCIVYCFFGILFIVMIYFSLRYYFLCFVYNEVPVHIHIYRDTCCVVYYLISIIIVIKIVKVT